MKYPFNNEQLAFWRKHGFITLHNFIPADVKKKLGQWCDELTAWPETPGKWMKYFEKNIHGERQLCRIENFLDYHEPLNAIAQGPRTLTCVSELMGEAAAIFKEKINYKLPNGSGFKPHQDAPAFISFKQTFHVTMMVAIDDCTLKNGCLQVAAGGLNKREILPQEKDGSICKEIAEKFIWTPIECKQGDVLLFDSYLPHYSEANQTQQPRRVFYLTYNKASEGGSMRQAYFQDKREKFPPDCERDPNKDYSAGASIYNVANPITESTK